MDGATQFHTRVQDANKNVKETYRDVRELITAVKEHNNKTTLWTSYAYDPLKEIVRVTDARGNRTTADYDNLGRRTRLTNVLSAPSANRFITFCPDFFPVFPSPAS